MKLAEAKYYTADFSKLKVLIYKISC
uniref:Uncharacterized protein n=1 Tax=Arundo donax TaxID=35708 RepID=A0A0A9C4C0_ARUDO